MSPKRPQSSLSVQQFSTLATHIGELKKNNTAWAHPKPTEPELPGVEPHRYFFVSHRASQVVLEVKNLPANAGDIRHTGSIPGSERSPWRRGWKPTPVFLPEESHGQRNLVGYSSWGRKESDITGATEHMHTQRF